ncbi:MAG: NUDIX domain-containing protein [Steroidobacteraceae bacterium]
MATKRNRCSAGLVMFRWSGSALQVFLVHPGGPYWVHRDAGAWSIPKGEYVAPEDALAAALREVREETGFSPPGPYLALTACTQPGGKRVQAWAAEAPDLEPAQLRSNAFTLEWPPRSGVQQQFPEVDRGAWFTLDEAHTKLSAGQRPLLHELAAKLAQCVSGTPVAPMR